MAQTSTQTATDSELLLQFTRNTDEDAFAELLRRHSGVVLGVCSSVLRNTDDAEDACQETFLTLARRANSVRVRSSIGGWLYRVARRVAVRLAKQRRALEEIGEIEATNECPLDIVARRELMLLLIEEISNLSEQYRDVVVLCHLQGLERSEAAEHLECTEDVVKARLTRGRRKLRLRLASRGVGFIFGMGLLTTACQKQAHAELVATVLGNVHAPTASILKPTNLFEELTTMKVTIITTSCVLLVAALLGLWPVPTAGSGSDDVFVRESASEDAGNEIPNDDETTNIVRSDTPPPPVRGPQQGASTDERRMNFEKQQPGQMPQYWEKVSGTGSWKITNNYATSGVSAVEFQGNDKLAKETNVLLLAPDHVRYGDVDLSIRLRLKQAMPGTGGGVMWNYKDKKNYLSAVLNSNGTVDVSRMTEGKSELLATVSSSASDATWWKLSVVHLADQASIFVNDARVMAFRADRNHEDGKVGLVSTATRLGVDDLQVRTPSTPTKNANSRRR